MKRKMRIITSASAASILAFAALAQETTKNAPGAAEYSRSEEHTSELQSLRHLVCRLLVGRPSSPTRPSSHLILTSAPAASILAFAALAQETTKNAPGAAEYSDQAVAHGTRAERPGCAKKASDLIGMEVKNSQNEKLGKVDDLAVDVESGRIVYVILSTGGLIGIGDTLRSEEHTSELQSL